MALLQFTVYYSVLSLSSLHTFKNRSNVTRFFSSSTFKPIQVITSLLTLFHVKNIKIEKKCYSKGFFYHTCMSNFVLDETKTPCKIFWIYLNGSQQATLCKVIKTTVSFGILRFAQFQTNKKIWNMKIDKNHC